MWIQVWNLPSDRISKAPGFQFKHLFLDVLSVIVLETGSKKGRCIKILAMVNLTKPLNRGTFISFGDKSVYVEFGYENLATFCYYCGKVGHLEKNCGNKMLDIIAGSGRQNQYRDWLRASLIIANLGESSKHLEGRARLSDTEGSPKEGKSFREEPSVGDQGMERTDRETTGQGQLQASTREGMANKNSEFHQQHQETSQVGKKMLEECHNLRVPKQEEIILV